MSSGFNELSPAGSAWAVTPSDSTDLTVPCRAFYIGTGGNIAIQTVDPLTRNIVTVTLTGVVAGTLYPIKTKRILATGTTATNIVALA